METVDVIIPAYRPGKEFEKLLDSLSTQNYPVEKILVMNTEEKFWNTAWEKKFPKVNVVHLKKADFDHGGTRCRGARLSDSDIMVFMTQDAVPADRNLIGNLIRPLQENSKLELPTQDSWLGRTVLTWKNTPEDLIIRKLLL